MAATAEGIAATIMQAAAQAGGNIWDQIRKGSQLYAKGYAQSLIDISRALADGDMTADEAKTATQNATFFFQMMIANSSQVTLHQVQTFLNSVINTVKSSVNAALPVPIL